MKTLIVIIVVLLASINMQAQNNGPTQQRMTINGIDTMVNPNMDYFKQDRFMRGWHWYLDTCKDCSALIQQRSCDLFVARSILFGF